MSLIKGKVGYDYRMLSMGEKLQLKFKLLTGKSETIEVSQVCTRKDQTLYYSFIY